MTVNPSDLIDRRPIGMFQVVAIGLCVLVTIFDGYDIQAMAMVAPVLLKEWNVEASTFGPVFSAALVGLLAGQLIWSALSDRYGRRTALIPCVFIFGFFSLACAFAESWEALLLFRFLAGIGLGGAMPVVLALAAELTPSRKRSLVTTIVVAGYAVGSVLGGYVASQIVSDGNWRGVFLVGGAGPLLLGAALIALLPESPAMLVRTGQWERLRRLLERIAPNTVGSDTRFETNEARVARISVFEILRQEYLHRTTMLWIAFFLAFLCLYCLTSWLPVFLSQRGIPTDLVMWVFIAYNFGAGVGGLNLGHLLDRHDPRMILPGAYVIGAGFIVVAGIEGVGWPEIVVLMLAAGYFFAGANVGLHALAIGLYPPEIRSTGIGAALAVGRIGAILGPLFGGVLLAAQVPQLGLFAIIACFPVLAALVLLSSPRPRLSPVPASDPVE